MAEIKSELVADFIPESVAGLLRNPQLGRAIVRDVYDRERSASALATIMMVMSLAPSLSPAIGAYLAQWVGWRADFVLLGAVGATVLILTAVKLEETHAPASANLASMIGASVLCCDPRCF